MHWWCYSKYSHIALSLSSSACSSRCINLLRTFRVASLAEAEAPSKASWMALTSSGSDVELDVETDLILLESLLVEGGAVCPLWCDPSSPSIMSAVQKTKKQGVITYVIFGW